MQPYLTRTIRDASLGEIGYICIANLVDGKSFGGVRLVPDIDPREMDACAQTMTYKFSFIGFPVGGAKSAIQFREDGVSSKADILRAFGRASAELLRNSQYIPGTDMNSTTADISEILKAAGLEGNLSGWKNRSHEYTAWSCYISTLAALEKRNLDLQSSSYTIQGFGKVASEYARLMSRSGAKLVGVSNRAAALRYDCGFDVDDLIQKRTDEGDRFILSYPHGKRISHDEIFALPVTVLLPAARARAIHAGNVDDIRADIVICAANAAMENSVEQKMFDRKKLVVPDFVANCGGVFGSFLEHEMKKNEIWELLKDVYGRKISQLLSASERLGNPVVALAREESEERIRSWSNYRDTWKTQITRRLRRRMPANFRLKWRTGFYEKLWGLDKL